MNKLMSLVMVALLALGANVSAQEEGEKEVVGAESSASGTAAKSTIGGIATSTVVIGAVAVGVAAAIISNNKSDDPPCRADQIDVNGSCQCPAGEVEINGVCGVEPPLEPECDAGDTLDGGVCFNVTFTTSFINSVTVQVPVTRTYLPTIRD